MDIVALVTLVGVVITLLIQAEAWRQRNKQIRIQEKLLSIKERQVSNDNTN
jgi:hypothetical protein